MYILRKKPMKMIGKRLAVQALCDDECPRCEWYCTVALFKCDDTCFVVFVTIHSQPICWTTWRDRRWVFFFCPLKIAKFFIPPENSFIHSTEFTHLILCKAPFVSKAFHFQHIQTHTPAQIRTTANEIAHHGNNVARWP